MIAEYMRSNCMVETTQELAGRRGTILIIDILVWPSVNEVSLGGGESTSAVRKYLNTFKVF